MDSEVSFIVSSLLIKIVSVLSASRWIAKAGGGSGIKSHPRFSTLSESMDSEGDPDWDFLARINSFSTLSESMDSEGKDCSDQCRWCGSFSTLSESMDSEAGLRPPSTATIEVSVLSASRWIAKAVS